MHDKFEFEKWHCSNCKDCLEHEETTACKNLFDDVNNFLEGKGYKVLHQNINRLVKKEENIQILLKEIKRGINTLGLSETHLCEGIPNKIANMER